MSALFEVAAEYLAAAEALAESDLDPQTISDTLEGMAGDVEEKSINVAFVIRNARAEAAAIKDAMVGMATRAKSAESLADRLTDYIKQHLESCAIKRVSCPFFVISIKANPAKVVIGDESLLPQQYWTKPIAPAPQPDKRAIADALKNGLAIDGARLETSTRLEIK